MPVRAIPTDLGKELVQWLRLKLLTPTEAEALHIANALYRLGYIVPVNERLSFVKFDNSCYRIQRPALWPSRKWEVAPQEYAVYLLKKQAKGKALNNSEQTTLNEIFETHKVSWSKLKEIAKDAVTRYNRGNKSDKDIEDSQDRSFWRVHRPVSAQKTHHFTTTGFTRDSICMEATNQNKKIEILRKKVKFMQLYLDKAWQHSEKTREKTITVLGNHCENYLLHDALICRRDSTNPWIAIDEYFYEDLLDLEEKKHTRLDFESWALSFKDLMKDRYGKGLFATFLQQEYSLENLYFWEACEDLRQSPQSKVATKIERIRRDFLESSSKFEVNLDRQVMQATLEEMTTPSRYCMDRAQRSIYDLMKNDCYPRFLKSDMYRDVLLESGDKRSKDNRERVTFIKKLYQKKERKSSISSIYAKFSSQHLSKPEAMTKFISSSDLQDTTVSPYGKRRASHASPSPFNRTPQLDADFAIRKAGSLSSLVAGNTPRKKNVAAKVTFEDEAEGASDDSGTYSGYSAATCSPKSKSAEKKVTLSKKHSFS
ncbi:regulator of G-protein signaling 6-like isoform X2 [Watersipora subatra]|uniref:regulator of G-protein signaling 6-like isoform X2 n=1 Tax=Watersipora subatra TaxID=2589382 RepID=UPI00355B2D16